MHQKSAGHSPLPPISFPNSYVMIRFAAAIISECLKTDGGFCLLQSRVLLVLLMI